MYNVNDVNFESPNLFNLETIHERFINHQNKWLKLEIEVLSFSGCNGVINYKHGCLSENYGVFSSLWLLMLPHQSEKVNVRERAMATSNFFICIPLQQTHTTLLNKPLIFKQVTLSSSSNSVILEEEGEKLKEPQSTIPSTSGCKACGREEIEKGCNGEGRIQGGIATVPGFGWWPIKAFRPCPGLVSSGGRYRRRGQSMDEVASGESKRMKKIIPKEMNDEIRPENDETQSRKKKKIGVEKQVLRAGTGPKTVSGQSVTVHCTGFGKNGDISQKFWSTKDWGQQPFTFAIGQGSVIKGWDEGVLGMQLGEVARLRCSPDFAYGAAGFPAWGILPNSVLEFEIELLSAK